MHLGLETYVTPFWYFAGILSFLLSIFWRPQIGLYYLMPLLPAQTARYHLQQYPFGNKVIDIILLGVLVGMIVRPEYKVSGRLPLRKLAILFVVFHYLSLWWGAFYLNSPLPLFTDPRFSNWKNYVEMLFLCFIVAHAIKKTTQIKLLLLIMCVSVLFISRAFHSTIAGRDLASSFNYSIRDSGPLGYAGVNGFAAFEAQFAVFLVAISAFEKRVLKKCFFWALIGICIYCILFAFSRGAYVGFLAALFFLSILKQRKLLIVLLLFLVSWQAVVPNSVRERISMTYNKDDKELDPSAGERIVLWQDALLLFAHQPLWGTGFDTYEWMGRVGSFRDTHNYYLKVLVETGIIGLTLLLVLFAKMFGLGFSLFRSAHDPFLKSLGLGLAALLVCAFVLNLFGDRWTFMQVNGFLWTILGCVIRGHIIEADGRGDNAQHASFQPGFNDFQELARVADTNEIELLEYDRKVSNDF